MHHNKEVAENVAKSLLQIKAVKLNSKKPFSWASGWKSPIYCDNRLVLSYPQIRTFIRQEFAKLISDEIGDVDVVVGVATGGIAMGALVAQDLGLPFAYVRSEKKDHGMVNQIEGRVESGHRAVVIEDLISTGASSLKAVNALKDIKVNVTAILAIFDYGFDVSQIRFKEAKCRVLSLSDYDTTIESAVNLEYISQTELTKLKKWREDPENWK
jgi:orotate phosphoribosyltransferase